MKKQWRYQITALLAVISFGLCAACTLLGETPGDRFRKLTKYVEGRCAARKLAPNEVCWTVSTAKPENPLSTSAGRYANGITIPNPVPEDNVTISSLSSEKYFQHLCQTFAGEFIFKSVENVDGVYQMRPRQVVWEEHLRNLFALEDVYGYTREEAEAPETIYVGPGRFKYLETSAKDESSSTRIVRYTGYDRRDIKTMRKEPDGTRKSRFGYTWRGINHPHERELGIVGGELIVFDLQSNEILAVRRGFIKGDVDLDSVFAIRGIAWEKRCPSYAPDEQIKFILNVLKPLS